MPPRTKPDAPPLSTRAKNKDAHPGAPDAPRPRKSTAQVKADKEAKVKATRVADAAQRAKVKRLATLEDTLAKEAMSSSVSESPAPDRARATKITSAKKQPPRKHLPGGGARSVNPEDDAEDFKAAEDQEAAEDFEAAEDEERAAEGEERAAEDDEDGAGRLFRRRKFSRVESDEEGTSEGDESEEDEQVFVTKPSGASRHRVQTSAEAVEDIEDDVEAAPVAAVNKHKVLKSRSQVDAVRRGTTGSMPKSVPEKRSAPDTRDSTAKSSAQAPPAKRTRPIGGLNSHWTPAPGKHQMERPPSASPERELFDEGPDGDKFQDSAPPMVQIKPPTSRPRPRPVQRSAISREEAPAANLDLNTTNNELDGFDNVRDQSTPAAAPSVNQPPSKSARVYASNRRVSKLAVHQDTNTLTQVSAPVAAKLGTKPRAVDGTPKRARKPQWTTDTLDEAIRPTFNGVFMPSVREFAGALPPWDEPTVKEVQMLFDKMYPDVELIIAKGEIIYDLTIQRLKEWRSMIGTEALNNVRMYLEGGVLEGDMNPDSGIHKSFVSAAAYVEWALSSEDGKNAPMYWATWNNGVKKEGRFQFHLILKTFSAHLAVIPANFLLYPSGALILCIVAVERALKFWVTGVQVIPRGPQGFFSRENWGDKTVRTDEGHMKLRRKAGKFVPAVGSLDDNCWLKIIDSAFAWLDKPAVAESDDVAELSDNDSDFEMTSDAPPPDSDDIMTSVAPAADSEDA